MKIRKESVVDVTRKRHNTVPNESILGLSVHRPEMIPLIRDAMDRSDAIFLEEAPDDGLQPMLCGSLPIEDYLLDLDLEYPEFSRQMCEVLKDLYVKGKKIVQVEPYLEVLLNIHNFFADGRHPEELKKDSIEYPVYLAERNATGALLAYYQISMAGSFEETIEAVRQFARLDAARFRLRDSLRAQALAPLVQNYPSAYIEAGMIHYQLWRLLRRQLPSEHRLRLHFLSDRALQPAADKRYPYSPGDQLTLLYVFHPAFSDPERESILAARALIYSKIISKEELTDDLNTMPHLQDELDCILTVRRLSLGDCRHLFLRVRRLKTAQAKQTVKDYLHEKDRLGVSTEF